MDFLCLCPALRLSQHRSQEVRECPPVAMSSQQTYCDREQCKVVLSTGADCVDVCVLCQTSKHCGNKNLESCNGPGWIQAIRKPSVLKECSLHSYDISYLMYFCDLQMLTEVNCCGCLQRVIPAADDHHIWFSP